MSFRNLTRDSLTLGEKFFSISWPFIGLIAMLTMVGYISLYAAAGGSNTPWAGPHVIRFAVGLIGLIITALIDIRLWMRFAYWIYALMVVLLVFVEVKGHIGMGAQRWIDLGFIRLQPSEVMKIVLVLAMARFFHGAAPEQLRNPLFLLIPLGLALLPFALVLIQPNLGTALMLLFIAAGMFFMGGVNHLYFSIPLGAGLAGFAAIWPFRQSVLEWLLSFLHDYQRRRVTTFLDPESDPLGAGYNIAQSKIAVGSGGMTGKGFLQGTQSKLNFLPEKQTDFIFTLFTEEWGFIGGAGLIGLLVMIILYGYFIAFNCQNQFGRLLVVGVIINFSLYIFINIGMVMGLLPVVGVPLPLVSHGGSSMLAVLFGFGLLMSAHVHRNVKFTRRGLDMA